MRHCKQRFSLAKLLAFTKSFASLVSRVTNYATDKSRKRLRKRKKPCKRETSARRVGFNSSVISFKMPSYIFFYNFRVHKYTMLKKALLSISASWMCCKSLVEQAGLNLINKAKELLLLLMTNSVTTFRFLQGNHRSRVNSSPVLPIV